MGTFHFGILFWYVFPIVILFACNFVISYFSLQERFKIRSVDLATLFLFFGLNELSKDTYQKSIVPFLIVSIFLLGMLIAIFLAYNYGEIQYEKFFKVLWRVVFLYTFAIYVLFILLNIIHYL